MVVTCCGQENYKDGDKKPWGPRQQLIQQIKDIIGEAEQRSRGRKRVKATGSGGVSWSTSGCCQDLEKECRQYRKRRECTPPLITTLALHEVRPTSDYTRMRHESSKEVTYVDATEQDPRDSVLNPVPPAPWELPRTPSQELRAGTLYQNCDCNKRNGLQQDCPRMGCGGRPRCLAVNPGPCCEPSKARKPVRGDRRNSRIEGYGQPWGEKNKETRGPGGQTPGSREGVTGWQEKGTSTSYPAGGATAGLPGDLMEAIVGAALSRGSPGPQAGVRQGQMGANIEGMVCFPIIAVPSQGQQRW